MSRYTNATKWLAREETLIKPYREYTGNRRIPFGQELWSFCDRQDRNDSTEKCEIIQFRDRKFCDPSQYRGFDYKKCDEVYANMDDWPSASFHAIRMEKCAGNLIDHDVIPAAIFADYCGAIDTFWSSNVGIKAGVPGLRASRDERNWGSLTNLCLAIAECETHVDPFIVVNVCGAQERWDYDIRDDLQNHIDRFLEIPEIASAGYGRVYSGEIYDYTSKPERGKSSEMVTFWLGRPN